MRQAQPTPRDERIEATRRDLAALRELFDRVIADLDDRVRRLEDRGPDGDARPVRRGR